MLVLTVSPFIDRYIILSSGWFFFPHSFAIFESSGLKKDPIKNCSVLCLVAQISDSL